MNISKPQAQKVLKLIEEKKLSWNKVQKYFFYLKILLNKLEGEEYIYWLKYLSKMISFGYDEMAANDAQLQKRLIQMFNISYKNFLMEPTNRNFSYAIFQISVIAHLVRSFPQAMYPYNKDFIENTIKLSQFTGKNKENEGKLSMVIYTLYFSFANNPELFNNPVLFENFKSHIVSQINKAEKQYNYHNYQVLCQIYQNLVQKIEQKLTKNTQYQNNSQLSYNLQ